LWSGPVPATDGWDVLRVCGPCLTVPT
jgi:hypothetical protein